MAGISWDSAPPAGHAPVMLREVMAALAPKPGETIIDGTFGAGGYSRAILQASASVVAIDRDPDAAPRAAALAADYKDLQFVPGRFSTLDHHARALGHSRVDGVVLDIGVSSFQLDEADRGFSFRHDGPLDMRMGGEGEGPSAADIVNRADMGDIAHILRTLGEERKAGAIARAIVADRPFKTTKQLADLCSSVLRGGDGIHPATRTFQALRIFVNDELGELAKALAAAENLLREGGRLVVVAFHSLEDRIVKRFLTARSRTATGSRHAPIPDGPAPTFAPIGKGAATAADDEVAQNPRARSAKLRAATRTAAPAQPFDLTDFVKPIRLKGFA